MKRLFTAGLIIAFVFVLCSCSNSDLLSDQSLSDEGVAQPQTGPMEFQSFEAFEAYENRMRSAENTCYYIPSALTDDYTLARITKREGVYISVAYSVDPSKVQTEGLSGYGAERLLTLICQYSLFEDGSVSLQGNFVSNGFEPIEYQGRTIYRLDEYDGNDPNGRCIGYEIAFLEEGKLIYMHLPAIDTFENMMKFADVVKVEIR